MLEASINKMDKAAIINLTRFCTDDGPGIRTTVFLKGCPLSCAWCHNPESQKTGPEILFDGDRCTLCGRCVPVCPQNCHRIIDGRHEFDRTACIGCGKCAAACPVSALEQIGGIVTVQEVYEEVARDVPFYMGKGGVTVSGGEPLAQPEFTANLLRLCREAGIHTAVETSGFCSRQTLETVMPYCDLVLFDLKETDEDRHMDFTGVPLAPILENLRTIDAMGIHTLIRAPIIPGCNDREEHLRKVRQIADSLTCCEGVEIMPYHAMGAYKYDRLGRAYRCDDVLEPEKATVDKWREIVK